MQIWANFLNDLAKEGYFNSSSPLGYAVQPTRPWDEENLHPRTEQEQFQFFSSTALNPSTKKYFPKLIMQFFFIISNKSVCMSFISRTGMNPRSTDHL